jgi:hypothetical protein
MVQNAMVLEGIYGREDAESAIAEVYGLNKAEVCCIMQQSKANDN